MATIYVRNVPDEVVERLGRLAARAGVSVNRLVLQELTEAARRADNADLLAGLPDLGISVADLLETFDRPFDGRGR